MVQPPALAVVGGASSNGVPAIHQKTLPVGYAQTQLLVRCRTLAPRRALTTHGPTPAFAAVRLPFRTHAHMRRDSKCVCSGAGGAGVRAELLVHAVSTNCSVIS